MFIQIYLNGFNFEEMCKYILNVQAVIQALCCKKWFDCSDCHEFVTAYPILSNPTTPPETAIALFNDF